MDIKKLQETIKPEPAYRKKQIKQLIFKELINDWAEATTLPLALRKKLNAECSLAVNGEIFASRDNQSAKALITLTDGLKIEAVLMRYQDKRNTVCISAQAGCPLGCSFCATGKLGFKRNLEIQEIAKQILFFARYLKKTGNKITNVVFMGMGEPFLNYANVLGAIALLNDKDGLGLGARHFSISTVGLAREIGKLADEKLAVNLAISLHAPNDELRSILMPINKKYPIGAILDAARDYAAKTKRRVMFEYIMIKGVNDSDACARQLASLMKNRLYFVNLISYNPTGVFEPSSGQRIKIFKEILKKEGVAVTQRYRFGDDIAAACGQLAGRHKN